MSWFRRSRVPLGGGAPLAVRALSESEDAVLAAEAQRSELPHLSQIYSRSDAVCEPFVYSPGGPIHFHLRGVGGSRVWGTVPRPITWELWARANVPFANGHRVPMNLLRHALFFEHALWQSSPRPILQVAILSRTRPVPSRFQKMCLARVRPLTLLRRMPCTRTEIALVCAAVGFSLIAICALSVRPRACCALCAPVYSVGFRPLRLTRSFSTLSAIVRPAVFSAFV